MNVRSLLARWGGAVWLGDGVDGGSFVVGAPFRVVLHTTETRGMPGYGGGRAAPHLTYDWRVRKFFQHTSLRVAARALANPAGGVETNRRGALQLEIIGYSDEVLAVQVGGMPVSQLPEYCLDDIAEFLKFAHLEFGVGLSCRLPRPPARYGLDSPSRMSGQVWDSFNGVCGHFEVPENKHWDTGALDIVGLLDRANGLLRPVPPVLEGGFGLISKTLDEAGWRELFRLGFAKAQSEDFLVYYWVDQAALRSEEEHVAASRNIFLEVARSAAS